MGRSGNGSMHHMHPIKTKDAYQTKWRNKGEPQKFKARKMKEWSKKKHIATYDFCVLNYNDYLKVKTLLSYLKSQDIKVLHSKASIFKEKNLFVEPQEVVDEIQPSGTGVFAPPIIHFPYLDIKIKLYKVDQQLGLNIAHDIISDGEHAMKENEYIDDRSMLKRFNPRMCKVILNEIRRSK